MRTIILAIAMIFFSPLQASPQTTDSSKAAPGIGELLRKYMQASGGNEAHQKLSTRVLRGEW